MKVSVIIPCYNAAAFIEDCLKSVEAQTYPHLEVICVDDGSKDETAFLIEKLIANSPLNIQLIRQENGGAPSARNNGLRHSTGDYIQFLDADDMLTPDKIKHQVEVAQAHDFPDLIVGSSRWENMEGEVVRTRSYQPNETQNLWLNLMKTDLGNTCANLFKAELFRNGIQWNVNMKSSQEYELMFQILKQRDHIVLDPEIHTVIRVRETGSISKSNTAANWERYTKLRVDMVEYLKQHRSERVDEEVYQVLFSCLRMLYPHNPEKATAWYEAYIPKGFVPQLSPVTGKSYLFLYRIMGFQLTEKIRRIFSNQKAG